MNKTIFKIKGRIIIVNQELIIKLGKWHEKRAKELNIAFMDEALRFMRVYKKHFGDSIVYSKEFNEILKEDNENEN